MAIASTLGPQSAKYLIISSEWSHLPPGGHDDDGDGPGLHLSPISNVKASRKSRDVDQRDAETGQNFTNNIHFVSVPCLVV